METYTITMRNIDERMYELPFISDADRANIRNEHKHKMSCAKGRKRRKRR